MVQMTGLLQGVARKGPRVVDRPRVAEAQAVVPAPAIEKPSLVQCPLCDTISMANAVSCPECRLDLTVSLPRTMGTFVLSPSELKHVFRWGVSSLENGTEVALHVEGYAEPLRAELEQKLVIGRYDRRVTGGPDLDLTLYSARQKGVSRLHAALLLEGPCVRIFDLGSINGSYLNGLRLLPHQPRILRDGDELMLGRLKVRVSLANQAEDQSLVSGFKWAGLEKGGDASDAPASGPGE